MTRLSAAAARLCLAALLLCPAALLFSQNKRPLEHADVQRWRKIEQPRLSDDGRWAAYTLAPTTEGDPVLNLWEAATSKTTAFTRATDAKFTADSKFLIFRIKPPLDTLKSMRRRKVKDDDLPKDTLGILTLATGQLEKIPRFKNFTVPEKWSGWIAYQIEGGKPPAAKKDTSTAKTNPAQNAKSKPNSPSLGGGRGEAPKPKKEDKDNGYRLIVRNTASGRQDTFAYVKDYTLAKRRPSLLLSTTGAGDTMTFAAQPNARQTGVYLFDLEKNALQSLHRGKGKYQQLALDEYARQAAYLADTDTTKARIRPWQLRYWSSEGKDSAQALVPPPSTFHPLPSPLISEYARPTFSDNGSKLYFGMAPPPVLNDTTLLPEEIVNVEVWAWTEPRIYTQQEVQLEAEKKRSYPAVWHTDKKRFALLGSPELPELRYTESRNPDLALGFTEEPYTRYITSEGSAHKDLYAVDLSSGSKRLIGKDLRCTPRISPAAKYIAWWSEPDTAWFAWNARTAATVRLTDNRSTKFYDEENDVPNYPDDYGLAGWLPDDTALLVYDRYDIWKIDPENKLQPERLTQGREAQVISRYIRLDPDARHIDPEKWALLHQMHQRTKAEGYAMLNLKTGEVRRISPNSATETDAQAEHFAYSRQPIKAKNRDCLMFTRENFQCFPDLLFATFVQNQMPAPKNIERISEANPQQEDYRWGSMEMVHWTSLSGEKLDGLLVKPDGFDPAKQYPMIVNFYEKNSDGLLAHRPPDFHRSQINFTYYASRGYLVFSPDIPYRTGYPGECAYDAIVSGVTSLMDKGFVDPSRVALQGHSWGGYQAAYLVTRTNLFRCAEAGAPVANMTSAYGGIRWESGLSRAFQYEHQQSRIGGTLWEYPMRYLENSPLFALDKVETPLLILHNDKDGAVPWYQGIELYSGLRRLGKPTWMLNYNDEPHWPVKLQNRADFQLRMQQFFDHYLMDKPMPRWMQRGVPPMEKGILQGLD